MIYNERCKSEKGWEREWRREWKREEDALPHSWQRSFDFWFHRENFKGTGIQSTAQRDRPHSRTGEVLE